MSTKYTVINDRVSSVEYETTFEELQATCREIGWEMDLTVRGEAIVTETGEVIAVETDHDFRPRKSLPHVCDLCGGKHDEFGIVSHNGKTIILLEQAYATSRLMNEYPNELQYQGDGETYMSEYAARGQDAKTGEKVKVFWHFEIEKEKYAGTSKRDGVYFYDTPEENYDWDDVHSVKSDE